VRPLHGPLPMEIGKPFTLRLRVLARRAELFINDAPTAFFDFWYLGSQRYAPEKECHILIPARDETYGPITLSVASLTVAASGPALTADMPVLPIKRAVEERTLMLQNVQGWREEQVNRLFEHYGTDKVKMAGDKAWVRSVVGIPVCCYATNPPQQV